MLQLLPHAFRLLHGGLATASQGDSATGGLARSLMGAVQAATTGGAVPLSALAPLQQLLWMLAAPEDKVLLSWPVRSGLT